MHGGPNPPSVRSVSGLGTAPMLLAGSSYAAGIVWARYVWTPPIWLMSAALMCATAGSFLLWRRAWRSATLGIFAVFAILGALGWQGSTAVPKPDGLRRFADNQEVELTGIVLNDATVAPGLYGGVKQTFDLAVESVTRDGAVLAANGSARLALYSKSGSNPEEPESETSAITASWLVRAGQRIRVVAKLGIPNNYGNPGAFDYRHYLERQGVYVAGGGKLESIVVLDENALPRMERWRQTVRRSILSRIHALWSPSQAAVLDAMLIGDASGIGREVRTDFQRSGTYHILVVSGFNVGILALLAFWLLRRLPTGDVVATVVTLVLAVGYTYLTNAGPPVVRASAMLAIYLITRLLYRDRAALNAVSTAALGLLVWDPESLFDPSFQLTFLSVVAIAGVVLPIVEMTSGPYHRALSQLGSIGYDSGLAPKLAQFRLDLRMVIGRMSRLVGRRIAFRGVSGCAAVGIGFFETLLVSTVMQFALAIPMAQYFHRATVTALVANALVVPATALMLPISICALCLQPISAMLAFPAKHITEWMLAFISGTVHLFGGMHVAELRIARPAQGFAMLASAGLVVALLLLRKRKYLWRWSGTALLVVTSSLFLYEAQAARIKPPGVLEVISIDVGQGDSFLIITPEGKSILLDSGGMLNGEHANFDIGEDVVSPFLWNLGISRLDVVAVSHTHVDHAGGMAWVIRNFRPTELWIPPGADVRERRRILEAAREERTTTVIREAGQAFQFGGAIFEVMNPPADLDFGPKVKDDDAMVLRVSYQKTSALFCGDIGKHAEERVMAQNKRADLLKVAHHGSANATSEEFLKAVHPSYAAISVGRRNSFGHPRWITLQKLAAAHARTYRTDMFGATVFRLNGKGVEAMPLALTNPQ